MKQKLTFIKIHFIKIISISFFILLFGAYAHIFAIGAPYTTGQTLDPACAPGEVNCTVAPALITMQMGAGITSATSGSILFAGTAGVLAQDNTNLFYNSTNHRLGIGTASPTSTFSVGSTSQFQVNSTGAIIAATGFTSSGTINFSGLTATTVPYLDSSKNLVSSSVTPTELGYLSGVTSSIQTQLGTKQATLTNADTTHSGILTSTDWNTFNGKQPSNSNLTSLSGLTYASPSFVKMTGAGTFTLDTNTYLTSLSGALLADGTVIGATSQAQAFTNGVKTGIIFPSSDSTTAIQFNKADGVTNILNIDTTNGRVGLGTATPSAKLSINNTATPTGSELITNGTFTGGTTGWTLGTDLAYGTNNVVMTYPGSGTTTLDTNFSTISGHSYIITFTISAANAPVYFYFNHDGLNNTFGPFLNGTQTITFQTNYTGTENLHIFNFPTNATGSTIGDTWTLDDVSIKEVTTYSPTFKITGIDGYPYLSFGDEGSYNTGLGSNTFVSNTKGQWNTAIGTKSLSSNTTGSYNTAIGMDSLIFNTTGNWNTAIGSQTLYSNTTGTYNDAFGYQTLFSNTTGIDNAAFGSSALEYNTTGTNNTALGVAALINNTTGGNNSAFGTSALRSNTTGSDNIVLGRNAMRYTVIASGNVAIGVSSGYGVSTVSSFSNNTMIGYQTGLALTSGSNNLLFGYNTGSGLTTGSNNLAIGYNINLPSNTASNQMTIGNLIYGTGIDGTGTTISSGSIGIGTATPNQQLEITKNFRLPATTSTTGIIYSGTDTLLHTFGTQNTFLGAGSGNLTMTGSGGNVGIGYQSLLSNTNGSFNTATGWSALNKNTTGTDNVAFGEVSLFNNKTGSSNTAYGSNTLFTNVSGTLNTAIGLQSLYNTTGSNNVGLGYNAGSNISSGSNNIVIGSDIAAPSATASNQLSIGNLIFGTAVDGTGTTISTGKIGIANKAPAYRLHVGSSADLTGTTIARFQNAGGTCDIVPSTSGGITCTSDERLKKNITTLPNGYLNKIDTLRPATYNLISEQDGAPLHTGFIAQEAEQIFPDLILTDPITGYKSISYSGFIPYTVKAMQELDLKVKGIENFDTNSTFTNNLTAWLANTTNKITRIFTGEICLTDTDGTSECINKTELHQLKQLINTTTQSSSPIIITPAPIINQTPPEELPPSVSLPEEIPQAESDPVITQLDSTPVTDSTPAPVTDPTVSPSPTSNPTLDPVPVSAN